MKGLSSTALQKTTSLAQAMPPCAAVRPAASLTTRPIRATASMLMPARVEPTLTLAQTSSVSARASGMEAMSLSSPDVMPFCTRAEKPPMKFTPTAWAARSMALAKGVKSDVRLAAPTMEMGVTATRLLTMGMPSSRSMASPVATSLSARRQIFS